MSNSAFNSIINQLNETIVDLTNDNNSIDANQVKKAGDTMTGDLFLSNKSALKLGESDVNGSNYVAISAPTILASDYTLILPSTQGGSGQVMTADGSGNLTWTTLSGSANQTLNTSSNVTFNQVTATSNFIGNLIGNVTATSVSSGLMTATTFTGKLVGDVQGTILQTSQTNITALGTLNSLKVAGVALVADQNQLQLQGLLSNNSNVIAIQAPAAISSNVTLTLPNTAGSSNQALSTDGSGLLSWQSVQPLSATLTSLSIYNTNGILTQTSSNTFTGRTIAGTANQITVTNGNGVSGNPTLSLPQDIATTSSPSFLGLTVSGLTISQVVLTNGSSALTTQAYSSTSTPTTFVTRDGSGNSGFNKLILDNGFTQSAGQYLVNSGSNAIPAIAYSGDGTSGFVFSTGNVDVATNTVKRARFNSSGLAVDLAISSGTTITAGTGLTVTSGGALISGGNISVTSGNISTSTGSITAANSLVVSSGGATITGNSSITGTFTNNGGAVNIGSIGEDNAINIGISASLGRITTIGSTVGTSKLNLLAGSSGINLTGIVLSQDTTESTSTANGSVQISGGVAIVKRLNVGGLLTTVEGVVLNSGSSSIAIGTDATTGAINIGTAASARLITIGNSTTTTGLFLTSGSGKINLSGATILDAGITVTGASIYNTQVTFNDSVILNSGASNDINIGTDVNNTQLNAGTAGVRTITIGNTNVGTKININSGSVAKINLNSPTVVIDSSVSSSTATGCLVLSGGIGISGAAYIGGIINGANGMTVNGAAISIATDGLTNAVNIGTNGNRTIIIGNSGSTNKINDNLFVNKFLNIKSAMIQNLTPTNLVSNTTLTASHLLNKVVTVDGVGVTITFPTAADIVVALPSVTVGDTISISLSVGPTADITIATNAGLTLVNVPTTHIKDTVRLYHFNITNIGSGTEAVSVY